MHEYSFSLRFVALVQHGCVEIDNFVVQPDEVHQALDALCSLSLSLSLSLCLCYINIKTESHNLGNIAHG